MNETISSCWLEADEDELLRELLDDESPLFIMPEEALQPNPSPEINQSMDHLAPTLCSWPIENNQSVDKICAASSQARLPIWERNLSKMEDNKYTLRLKCCGNGMADDGYKWRKYGQKSIKNSPYPRSYYRCTNPRCSAKKQVERSREDEDTLIITYEGLHLHFAYPYFLLNQSPTPPDPDPPSKRPKNTTTASVESEPRPDQTHTTPPETVGESTSWTSNGPDFVGLERMSSQGLLEDVVPFMVRNPNQSSNITYSSSSCSSYQSSPPASPPSLSWSPTLY